MEGTIESLSRDLENGKTTAVALVQSYIARAEEKNPELNMYREIFSDALEQAAAADAMRAAGKATNLTGIPIAIKDNILFKGHHAGAASKILEGYVASYDADVVVALKAAGAVIIGRTNMDEFAMGSSTENSAYGPTRNPFDIARVPGGSSGGSAAAVAAGAAVAALGSDTAGSIRQPASFCGLVGLLPTYGTVSRSGLIAMGSSLDVIGPFAKTVADAEILYKTIATYSTYDSTCVPVELRTTSLELKKKIAVPWSMLRGEAIDPGVLKNFEDIVKKLQAVGYVIEDISLPTKQYKIAVISKITIIVAITRISFQNAPVRK